MWNYECFDCRRVFMALQEKPEKCPRCGKTTGQIVTDEHLEKAFKSGLYYNDKPGSGRSKRR
jgi:rRNA maturation endonuclease Nob1